MKETFKIAVSNDGKLKVFDKKKFDKVVSSKNGKIGFITIEFEDEKASVFALSYFRKVICQRFQEIFKREFGSFNSLEMIENELKGWCPIGRDEAGEPKETEQYSVQEMNELIRHSKYIASKEFDVYIED